MLFNSINIYNYKIYIQLPNKNTFLYLDTSLYCPTSVIVTANISQEKTVENYNDTDENNDKNGKYLDRFDGICLSWIHHSTIFFF